MRTQAEKNRLLPLHEILRSMAELRRTLPTSVATGAVYRQFSGVLTAYMHFRRNTRMAVLVHGMFVLLLLGTLLARTSWYPVVLSILCFAAFLAFLGMSAQNRSDFYAGIGKTPGRGPIWKRLLILPACYFNFRHQDRRMRRDLSDLFRGLADRHPDAA